MDRRPRQTFAYVQENGYDATTRTLRATISTNNKDRHGEVVEPRAFEKNIDHYLANPVVLAGHQHRLTDGSVPVIGLVEELAFYDDRVDAVIRFAPADVNPLGPQYDRAYELGFMRAFSVGFIPIEVRVEEGEPFTHTESELIELSAVAVPSNRQSLSGGKATDAALAKFMESIPGFSDNDGDPDSGAVYLLADPEAYATVGAVKGFIDLSDDVAGEAVRTKAHEAADAVRATILAGCTPVAKSWMAEHPAMRSSSGGPGGEAIIGGPKIMHALNGITERTHDMGKAVESVTETLRKMSPDVRERVLAAIREPEPIEESDADETLTVQLRDEARAALDAYEKAITAAADKAADAAERIERAVSALLGEVEPTEPAPEPEKAADPHVTPRPDIGVLKSLADVLQKNLNKRDA